MEMTKELADKLSECLACIWENYGGSIKKVATRANVPEKFIWNISKNKHRAQSKIKDENVLKIIDCYKEQLNLNQAVDHLAGIQTGPGVDISLAKQVIGEPDPFLQEKRDAMEQLQLIKGDAVRALNAFNAAVAGAKDFGGTFLLAELDGERTGELQIIKLEMKVSI